MNLSPTIFPHISTAPCRNRIFHPQPGLALFYSLPAQNLVIRRDLTATLHKEVNVIGRTMNAHPWTIIACMGQRSPKTSEYPTHLTAQHTDMALVSSRHVATRDNGLIWPYALASTCLISSRYDKRNPAMDDDNDNDNDNVKDLYVICYTLISLIMHCSFYRKDEEKELLLNTYTGILNLIPKLKKVLLLNDDVNEDYLPKVINAVRSAHTPCDTMTSIVVPTLVNYIIVLLGECSICCNWNQSLICKRYICTIVLLSEIIYLYYSIIIILIYLYFSITFKWLTHIIVLLTNDISIF